MDVTEIEARLDEDGPEGQYVLEYDGSESLGTVIPLAVAAIRDEDPMGIEPFGRLVDAEALDALYFGAATGGRALEVTFTYASVRVQVRDGGTIVFDDSDAADASTDG